jgi:hypothetical protein
MDGAHLKGVLWVLGFVVVLQLLLLTLQTQKML